MILRASSLAVMVALLTGCAQPRSPLQTYRQALEQAPGNAQPSRIVAREIELAKRAREIGRPEAALEFSAPNAVVLTAAGDAPTTQFQAIAAAGAIDSWQPKTVWLSCDGVSAVSEGRFRTSDGLVGDYVTTWVRDRTLGTYFWIQNSAALDDPQPPTPTQPEPAPGEIVVDGLISVQGRVADCEAPPAPLPVAASPMREMRSRDGTLVWRWSNADSGRRIEVHAWTEGEWRVVLDRHWEREASS